MAAVRRAAQAIVAAERRHRPIDLSTNLRRIAALRQFEAEAAAPAAAVSSADAPPARTPADPRRVPFHQALRRNVIARHGAATWRAWYERLELRLVGDTCPCVLVPMKVYASELQKHGDLDALARQHNRTLQLSVQPGQPYWSPRRSGRCC